MTNFRTANFFLILFLSLFAHLGMTDIQAGGTAVRECTVCMIDYAPDYFVGFACKQNHTICAGCMTEHLNTYKTHRTDGLKCPIRGCPREITNEKEFVNRERWDLFLGKDYINDIVQILKQQAAEKFKIASLEGVDEETKRTILATTRPCPRCKAPIEKNKGCYKMDCKKMWTIFLLGMYERMAIWRSWRSFYVS